MQPAVAELYNQFLTLRNTLSRFTGDKGNWFNAQDLILSNAFHCRSEEVSPYLKELENNIRHLDLISNLEHAEYLSQTIRDQFACLRNLSNSQNVNQKHMAYRQKSKRQLQQVKSLSKRANQSSQELYQELSKLQEFERRLLEMVNDKQAELNKYQGQKLRQDLQTQVLLTQQRLGRCRQAISKVEEQIQALDNRN